MKMIVKMVIWSIAVSSAEAWSLRFEDVRKIEPLLKI